MSEQTETYFGPWHILTRVTGVVCEDGTRRTCYPAASGPDTYFSIPARTRAYGRTVTGYLSKDDDGRWIFRAYRYRKNWRLVNAPRTDTARS